MIFHASLVGVSVLNSSFVLSAIDFEYLILRTLSHPGLLGRSVMCGMM